jgi:hypothetical protein
VDSGVCWHAWFGFQVLFRVSRLGLDISRRRVTDLHLVLQLYSVLAPGSPIVFSPETKRSKAATITPHSNCMKLAIILGLPVIAVVIFIATACRKRGPEADAAAAVGRGEYQFIALLDPEGKWTRPEFSDIPAWYFETTGVRVQTTKPKQRRRTSRT